MAKNINKINNVGIDLEAIDEINRQSFLNKSVNIKLEKKVNHSVLDNYNEEDKEYIEGIILTNARELTIIFKDNTEQAIKDRIKNEFLSEESNFVLTNSNNKNIKDIDFSIFDIETKTFYNDKMEIKRKEYYVNDILAVKETFTYIYRENTNNIKEIKKYLQWFRFDGRVGTSKMLNRKYDDISSDEKSTEIRKEKMKKIKNIISKKIEDPSLLKTNMKSLEKKMKDYIEYNDTTALINELKNNVLINIDLEDII